MTSFIGISLALENMVCPEDLSSESAGFSLFHYGSRIMNYSTSGSTLILGPLFNVGGAVLKTTARVVDLCDQIAQESITFLYDEDPSEFLSSHEVNLLEKETTPSIQAMSHILSDIEHDVGKLAVENERLEAGISQAQEKQKEAEARVQQIEQENGVLKNQVTQLMEEKERVAALFYQFVAEKENKTQELKQLQTVLQNQQKEIESYRCDLASLHAEKSEWERGVVDEQNIVETKLNQALVDIKLEQNKRSEAEKKLRTVTEALAVYKASLEEYDSESLLLGLASNENSAPLAEVMRTLLELSRTDI